MAKAGLLTRPKDLGLRQTLPLSRPKALLQRLEPVTIELRTPGLHHQADVRFAHRRSTERQLFEVLLA